MRSQPHNHNHKSDESPRVTAEAWWWWLWWWWWSSQSLASRAPPPVILSLKSPGITGGFREEAQAHADRDVRTNLMYTKLFRWARPTYEGNNAPWLCQHILLIKHRPVKCYVSFLGRSPSAFSPLWPWHHPRSRGRRSESFQGYDGPPFMSLLRAVRSASTALGD